MHKKTKLYISSLRLDRWPRSLAIIPGFLAALVIIPGRMAGFSPIADPARLILAFILTWIISTANYIINEITDAPFDAHHPAKKNRPLVNGSISRLVLMLIYFLMVLFSLAVAWMLYNLHFLLSLSALLVAGLIYNVPPVRVKDIPVLDSTVESANNPIRFLIGWYIFINPFPPASLLISWWAFGNFLMVGKRVAEKKFLTPAEAEGYRLSLKKYSQKTLVVFMIFNALAFLFTFAWFVIKLKWFLFLYSLPFIIVYLAMFMRKSLQDREGAEEPEKILKNPYFALYTLFMGVLFILAYLFS